MHKYIVVVELSKNRGSEYRKLDSVMLEAGFQKSLSGKNKKLYALPRGVFSLISDSPKKLPYFRKSVFNLVKDLSDNPQILVVDYNGGSWDLPGA